jgi:hypothetical protein
MSPHFPAARGLQSQLLDITFHYGSIEPFKGLLAAQSCPVRCSSFWPPSSWCLTPALKVAQRWCLAPALPSAECPPKLCMRIKRLVDTMATSFVRTGSFPPWCQEQRWMKMSARKFATCKNNSRKGPAGSLHRPKIQVTFNRYDQPKLPMPPIPGRPPPISGMRPAPFQACRRRWLPS